MKSITKNLLLTAGLCLATAASAQDLKPGLWEMSHDMDTPGNPEMAQQMKQMQAMMDQLPAAQRKMLEQQMGVSLGKGGMSVRVCMTPEDVKLGALKEGHSDGDCTYRNVKKSGNTIRANLECKDGKGEFAATIHDPTHYTGTGKIQTSQGLVSIKTNARLVSSDCGSVGSIRQLGKAQRPAGR